MRLTENKISRVVGLILWVFVCSACGARVWTSADGGQKFKADFKLYEPKLDAVQLVKGGQLVVYELKKFSEEDRDWVVREHKNQKKVLAREQAFKNQKVGQTLKTGVLKKFDGEKFKDYTLEKMPEYYFVYFGASW